MPSENLCQIWTQFRHLGEELLEKRFDEIEKGIYGRWIWYDTYNNIFPKEPLMVSLLMLLLYLNKMPGDLQEGLKDRKELMGGFWFSALQKNLKSCKKIRIPSCFSSSFHQIFLIYICKLFWVHSSNVHQDASKPSLTVLTPIIVAITKEIFVSYDKLASATEYKCFFLTCQIVLLPMWLDSYKTPT